MADLDDSVMQRCQPPRFSCSFGPRAKCNPSRRSAPAQGHRSLSPTCENGERKQETDARNTQQQELSTYSSDVGPDIRLTAPGLTPSDQ